MKTGRPQSDRILFVSEHFLSHPKISELTDREFREWVFVLIEQLRSNNGGNLPTHAYGIPRQRLRRFAELGLLDSEGDRYHVHGWEKWNGREAYKRFLARERKRRQREREAEVESA